MPGSSPLADDLDMVRRLEDAGAAEIVLRSLFEEQILGDELATYYAHEAPSESYAEALSYLPDPGMFSLGTHEYLEQLQRIKAAVSVPVIASLNGTTPDNWFEYARLIAEAGADALELNIYDLPIDPRESSDDVERRVIDVVTTLRETVPLPLAVKLSPFYSAFSHFARRLKQAGADGLVIFNRFYRPDIDVENLGRSRASLEPGEFPAACGGCRFCQARSRWARGAGGGYTTVDAVKAVMAGARRQMVSVLLRRGPGHPAHAGGSPVARGARTSRSARCRKLSGGNPPARAPITCGFRVGGRKTSFFREAITSHRSRLHPAAEGVRP
jgi:dihydroorotate dehydrogenase (fumarate)